MLRGTWYHHHGSVTLCLVPSMPLHDHLVYYVEIKVLVCVFQVQSVSFFSDAASLRFAKQEALLCLVLDGKGKFGPSSESCGGMESILVAFVFPLVLSFPCIQTSQC